MSFKKIHDNSYINKDIIIKAFRSNGKAGYEYWLDLISGAREQILKVDYDEIVKSLEKINADTYYNKDKIISVFSVAGPKYMLALRNGAVVEISSTDYAGLIADIDADDDADLDIQERIKFISLTGGTETVTDNTPLTEAQLTVLTDSQMNYIINGNDVYKLSSTIDDGDIFEYSCVTMDTSQKIYCKAIFIYMDGANAGKWYKIEKEIAKEQPAAAPSVDTGVENG